jgi:hypothetical protein
MAPNISSRCMVPTRVMCIYPHEIRRNTTVAIVMSVLWPCTPKTGSRIYERQVTSLSAVDQVEGGGPPPLTGGADVIVLGATRLFGDHEL